MQTDAKLDRAVAAIGGLSRQELVDAWIKAYGTPPPKGIKRPLLELSAAWHVQARRLGGLSASTKKALLKADSSQRKNRDGWRLPAAELESIVEAALIQHLGNAAQLIEDIGELIEPGTIARTIATAFQLAASWPEQIVEQRRATVAKLVRRIDLQRGELSIQIDRIALCELVSGSPVDRQADLTVTIIPISHPISLRRRGVETKIVLTNGPAVTRSQDKKLIELLARAHSFLNCLTSGRRNSLTDVATAHQTNVSEVSRLLPLAFLSSKIITAIVSGTQPIEITAQKLSRVTELPIFWREQEALLQF
jgi:hypothetical protein